MRTTFLAYSCTSSPSNDLIHKLSYIFLKLSSQLVVLLLMFANIALYLMRNILKGAFDFLLGDPAGARNKPGSGYGYGLGIRVDSPLGPLRLEYAFNDKKEKRFHFGVGYRN